MSHVRLKCPVCNTIVKVTEDLVFRQPVLRCARCHGLVEVARHRLSLLDEAQVDEKADLPEPGQQIPDRDPSSMTAMIVGSIAGLAFLSGLGWLVYYVGFRH